MSRYLKNLKWGRRRIGDNRRVTRYIDGRLQGVLIAAILLLELLLIVVGLIILHYDLHQIMEEQLFRVHPGVQEGMPLLVRHLISAMGVIVLANISLVIVIEWFWSNYVAKIVTELKSILDSVCVLDLRHDADPVVNHDVLNRAREWLQIERFRCVQLLRLTEELSPDMDAAEAIKVIAEMRQHLPQKPAEDIGFRKSLL